MDAQPPFRLALRPMLTRRTVHDIINDFVTELTAALEAQTTAAIRGALAGRETGNGRRRRAQGIAPASAPRRKGGKRTPEALEALTKNLLTTIKRKPGLGIEALAEAMSTSTKELTLPMKKLIAERKVKATGQKRGMRYSVR
jgi:hypothetical protein